MKKIIKWEDQVVSMVNKSILKSDLMKHIVNVQLRQDAEKSNIYYLIIMLDSKEKKTIKDEAPRKKSDKKQ